MNLQNEIMMVLNKHRRENNSNTPDFILAMYLESCLLAFEKATQQREAWYGRDACPTSNATPSSTRCSGIY